jgi:hypothetical protein
LVMNWGIFLSVVDVAYHLLNLVFIWQKLEWLLEILNFICKG